MLGFCFTDGVLLGFCITDGVLLGFCITDAFYLAKCHSLASFTPGNKHLNPAFDSLMPFLKKNITIT